MPVTDKQRSDYRALDAAARQNVINEQLKRIREGCANPGMVDTVQMNDALDQIAALQEAKPEVKPYFAKPVAPTLKPLGVPASVTPAGQVPRA